MSKVTVATSSAVVSIAGGRVTVQAGTAWHADDPVVRAYPHLFSDDEKYLHRTDDAVIESATAAPGERRGTRRRAKADD